MANHACKDEGILPTTTSRPDLRPALSGALVLIGAGFVSGCARGGLPEPATAEGQHVVGLWQFFLWLAAVVAGLIWALTGYVVVSSLRRRRRSHDDGPPPQRQYATRLEIVYTAIPVLVVAALFAGTLRVNNILDADARAPDLQVEVIGFQWQWQFRYPAQPAVPDTDIVISGQPGPDGIPELVLPVGARVRFSLVTADVIHSFWVPEFLEKRDLIPGVDNQIEVKVIREGVFVGRCAEYCGLDHWLMTFTVRALPPDQFHRWVQDQQARPQPQVAGARGDSTGTTATTSPVSGA